MLPQMGPNQIPFFDLARWRVETAPVRLGVQRDHRSA